MKQRRMLFIRIGVALLVLAIALIGFNFDTAIGTLCTICPVGFVGVSAASGSIPWQLLPGVLIVLVLVVVFGRVFCSWLCTTSLLKNIFGGSKTRGLTGRTGELPSAASGEAKPSVLASTNEESLRGVNNEKDMSQGVQSSCSGACNKSTWGWPQFLVLGVLFVVSLVVRFPVFCLFCPIGLAFGTLWAVNRTFVLLQPGWELIIFPLILIIEIFFLKRWCSAICPLGAFFTLSTKLRTKFGWGVGPRVESKTCIASEGCTVCAKTCPENIDVAHASTKELEACTLCVDCVEQCPTQSIKIK